MLVTIGICFKLYFDTRHFAFCNLSPSRMFLSLDLLPEYRIQHTIGLLYVTSIYWTIIFYRGVSGFATDCPCGVWCRGLTTCLLYVGPLFGYLLLNNSWAVGLTWRWHIRSILSMTGRGISAETCGVGLCVSSWWPMFSSRSSVSLYIYLYVCILYTGSGYRIYIYIYTGSVILYWWSCTPSQSIWLGFGSVRFLCWMPLVVFFGFNHLCLTLW